MINIQHKALVCSYVLTVVLGVGRVVRVEVVLVAVAVPQLGLAVPQLRGHLARAPVRRGPGHIHRAVEIRNVEICY